MKIIIAGSRSFNNYEFLKKQLDCLFKNIKSLEIVSGCARGSDALGERYAKERGYILHRFPADWDRYGKSAGYIRNKEMACFADRLVAFWDGKSKGTRHMIDLAKKRNLIIKVVEY